MKKNFGFNRHHNWRIYRVLCFNFLLICLLTGCASEEEKMASHLEKARHSIEDNNWDVAVIELKNVIQLDPDNDEVYFMLGNVYAARKEFQAAADAYGNAINLNPDNLAAHYKMGHIFLAAGRPMEARKAAKYIIDKKPGDMGAYQLMAAVQIQENNAAGAIKTLSEAIQIKPNAMMPRLFLANLLANTGELERAESIYLETISIHSKAALPHIELATFYAKSRRWDKVRAVLNKVDAISGKDYRKASYLLRRLEQNRQWELAEEVLSKSVKAAGDESEPLMDMGVYFARRGNYEKALEIMNRALEKDKDNPQIFLNLARIQMDARQLEAAETSVDKALAIDGNNATGNALKGELLYSRKAYAEAISRLDLAITNAPDNYRAYYYKARALMNRGAVVQEDADLFRAAAGFHDDPDAWVQKQVIDNLQKAIEINPDLLQAKIILADIYLRKGRTDLAREMIDDVLEQAPNHPQAISLLGSLKVMDGDLSGAEILCRKVLAERPDAAYWHYRLGMVYRLMDRPRDALGAFDRSLELDPLLFNALKLTVGLYIQEKNYDAALSACEKQKQTVNGDPRLLAVIENLEGTIWMARGDSEAASRHFRAALAALPDLISSRMGLADIFEKENRVSEAVSLYKEILSINEDYLPAYMALGRIHSSQKQQKEAEKYYRRALKIKPNHIPAANNLAFLLSFDDGKLHEALDLAKFARTKQPRNAFVRDTLGWLYYRTGQYGKAADELEASLKVNPDYALANYHLGLAYYRLERFEDARRLMKKALSIDPNFEGAEEARSLIE